MFCYEVYTLNITFNNYNKSIGFFMCAFLMQYCPKIAPPCMLYKNKICFIMMEVPM